jgi:hypothetical protein
MYIDKKKRRAEERKTETMLKIVQVTVAKLKLGVRETTRSGRGRGNDRAERTRTKRRGQNEEPMVVRDKSQARVADLRSASSSFAKSRGNSRG